MFKAILTSLLGSWQGMLTIFVLITVAVGSAELYVYNKGVDHGAKSVQTKWDAFTALENKEIDQLRAATQKGSDAAETKAINALTKVDKQQGNLDNEIKSNPTYNCAVPINGVRLYNQSAGF